MLKLYNTLSREKESFKPIHKDRVGLYTCGPTVYWYQHIGNLRTYIFSDVLKRVLTHDGFKVKHVMNVTDVGHLTSDADEGEDKMEAAAKKEGKKAKDIAEYYLKVFREDLKRLNIIEPDVWCKATEYIQEQIELVKKLEDNGFTYKTEDGIYYNTSKFKNYGVLAKLRIENLKAGHRVNLGEKKHKTDFALWKFSEHEGKRQQEWNSPWGTGFPGWHIECSAMSMKFLGNHFDIHTGGEDHIPVHHTNEIAQSEAATGEKFVNYWLHGLFLTFKGEKVSKSKGGLFTISELEEQKFKPMAFRYLCLNSKYNAKLDFSLEALKNAQNSYERLRNILAEIEDDNTINETYVKKFEHAINDDLDMPSALALLWEMLRDEDAEGKKKTAAEMDKVFGLDLLKEDSFDIPEDIQKIVDERAQARKHKDFKKSDELRDTLKEKGYIIDDTKDGQKVKKL